jgi:adenosylhomocysteine nucleosidase
MGHGAAARALDWLFGSGPDRPAAVLSAGFSGALRPEAKVGHLVAATELVAPPDQVWPVTWCPDLAAELAGTVLHRGRLLCMPELVTDPRDKQRLSEEYRALAVDMETAAVAQFCHAHRVPFGCLRVISDGFDTPLSGRLATLLRGGRVSPVRLAAALARSPALIVEMCRLATATRRAARLLARGLEELLGPHGAAPVADAGAGPMN